MSLLHLAVNAVSAWETYDAARAEYESAKQTWENACTTKAANHYLPAARVARDAYAKALTDLRALGYSPSGPEPIGVSQLKVE